MNLINKPLVDLHVNCFYNSENKICWLFLIRSGHVIFTCIIQCNFKRKLPHDFSYFTVLHNNDSQQYSNYLGVSAQQRLYCMLTEKLYWGVKPFVTVSWLFGSFLFLSSSELIGLFPVFDISYIYDVLTGKL